MNHQPQLTTHDASSHPAVSITLAGQAELLAGRSRAVKQSLRQESKAAVASMGRLFDLRGWTRQFPWKLTGLAACTGFVVTSATTSRQVAKPNVESNSEDEVNRKDPSLLDQIQSQAAGLGRRVVEGLIVTLATGAVSSAMTSTETSTPPADHQTV